MPNVAMGTTEEELVLHTDDGHEIGAFWVAPQTAGAQADRRAVILMTDIHGYKNEETRAVAQRLALSGLPTIVPDLFRGEPWEEGRSTSEYETWRLLHTSSRVRSDVRAARDDVLERGCGESLGLMGFCFGGGRLMEEIALSTGGLDPKAAVAFYPTRFDAEHVGRNASCPLLFVTGDSDNLVPMGVVEKLKQALAKNDDMDTYDVKVLKGYGHAFVHHPRSERDKKQSEVELDNAVAWLNHHL